MYMPLTDDSNAFNRYSCNHDSTITVTRHSYVSHRHQSVIDVSARCAQKQYIPFELLLEGRLSKGIIASSACKHESLRLDTVP
jgi:hypothetical protein